MPAWQDLAPSRTPTWSFRSQDRAWECAGGLGVTLVGSPPSQSGGPGAGGQEEGLAFLREGLWEAAHLQARGSQGDGARGGAHAAPRKSDRSQQHVEDWGTGVWVSSGFPVACPDSQTHVSCRPPPYPTLHTIPGLRFLCKCTLPQSLRTDTWSCSQTRLTLFTDTPASVAGPSLTGNSSVPGQQFCVLMSMWQLTVVCRGLSCVTFSVSFALGSRGLRRLFKKISCSSTPGLD